MLHQGRIERLFLDSIREHGNMVVERGVLPTSLDLDEDKMADFNDYPIQHHQSADGQEEAVSDGLFRSNLAADDTDDLIRSTKAQAPADQVESIKAKFFVGCDGAHSWVRRQLGLHLEGEPTDYIWGVLDIVPITSFPDIRQRCDAVHTHSPKAGQGMNVSMQDTYNLGWKLAYNLGWKLAHVVKGYSDGSILKTYESERRKIEQDLITFDHRFSRHFSGRPAKDIMDEKGVSMEEFKAAFEKGNEFASGITVKYEASVLVAKERDSAEAKSSTTITSEPHLATGVDIGKRMPSFKALQPHLFADLPPSDGLIEVLTIQAGRRKSIELLDLPELFHPYSETMGWDYWKVFVDDGSYYEGHGNAYANYGIDPVQGASLIMRPDQYMSWVGEVDEYDVMDMFFTGFMKP
ncbi:hypothetical protein N7462_005259 [Penicillium macrosclerotiorum]|uniref:uncharacterized protein n=1 Tax=Penicillium macrosclerotiorum TaxID=303699 RepID=UPI0025496410|nr:uncharacterized protein N7462_005259 [Penicillium macrosclerotiorum]KAJ5690867.1 hypothetical protein N7462_005259 [Penicillium macrosclerotiorum]